MKVCKVVHIFIFQTIFIGKGKAIIIVYQSFLLRGSNYLQDIIEKLHEPKVKSFRSFILLEG